MASLQSAPNLADKLFSEETTECTFQLDTLSGCRSLLSSQAVFEEHVCYPGLNFTITPGPAPSLTQQPSPRKETELEAGAVV